VPEPTRPLAPATVAVTAGRPPSAADAPLNPPVVLSSTYHAGGPMGYARHGNPTWTALEEVLGALEGGTALTFASGMGAVAAVLDTVPVGAAVVAPAHAYSGTSALLRNRAAEGRLELRTVDVADTAAVVAAVQGAALLWLESPTNPALEVADLAACADAGHRAGALVVCDNTFATPLVQRPLEHGVDVVVHSVTKYLAGHSDVLLGATVTANADLHARLQQRRTLLGAIPGPMEAWLALRGLRTLHLRMERAQHNAGVLAGRLQQRADVRRVRYPGLPGDPGHDRARRQMAGFGAVVSAEVADAATADRWVAGTRLWAPATSLGGVESTFERRRRWPEESPDIPEGLVRLSVGCEDVEDLWTDLAAALDQATAGRPPRRLVP